jgi:hypothetical protein
MPKTERLREVPAGPPGSPYWQEKVGAGWNLAAVIWEREVEGAPERPGELDEEIPYGLRVADDCSRLVEHPAEKKALMLMMTLIVEDTPLARVAEALNDQGFRTRQGTRWAADAVFDLLPRLIQVGPRIFSSEEWASRRPRFSSVAHRPVNA